MGVLRCKICRCIGVNQYYMCYDCQTVVEHIAALRRKKRRWLYIHLMLDSSFALKKAREYTKDIGVSQSYLDARRDIHEQDQSHRVHEGTKVMVP